MPDRDEQRRPAFDAVIPAPVRHCEKLCPNAKLVYGEIRALSDHYGYCWAGNGFFSELYSITERSVARIISQLSELGFISIQILRDKEGHVSGRRIYVGSGFPEPENDTLSHMTKKSARLTKMSGQTDKNVSQDIINNNNITNKGVRAKNDAAARDELKAWAVERYGQASEQDLIPLLMAFCDNRVAKRNPLPPGRAVTGLTNRLIRYSQGDLSIVIELLNESVLHSWDSVYPLKPELVPAQASPSEVHEKWV